MQIEAIFCAALLLPPDIRNVPFVVCSYGRGDEEEIGPRVPVEIPAFYTPSAVKDNRASASLKACWSFVPRSSFEVKNGEERPPCCCNKTLLLQQTPYQ